MRSVLSLLLGSLLATTACASSSETTEANGGQAIAERWISSVEAGVYDATNASISIQNTLQGKRLVFAAETVFFAGSVERDGDGIKAEDDHGEGVITVKQDGANIIASHDGPGFLGDFADASFVRRPANALKKVYPWRNGGVFEVESSTDDRLTLRITTSAGRTYHATATLPSWPVKSASSYELDGELDGCTVTVERLAGSFAFQFLPGLNEKCPLDADWVPR